MWRRWRRRRRRRRPRAAGRTPARYPTPTEKTTLRGGRDAPSASGGGDDSGTTTALARAVETFDRFAGGALLERLRSLHGHILARELPVLLPPPEARAALPAGDAGDLDAGPPVGFVAGTVDLLYRDPETGALVVADYKTDRVASAKELSEVYASQGEAYVAAVRDGLGLVEPAASRVRFEIWSLHLDRVIPLAGRADAPPAVRAAGPAQLSLFSDDESG